MISFKTTGFTIEKVSDLQHLSEQDYGSIMKDELNNGLVVIIPSRFNNNKDKTIYKTGFVIEFLKYIYPEKKFSDICEIINIRYQVFLDRRAIERKMKEYDSNDIFK
tara:strand:- start:7851 stop:8171 length:321 start_codon:yes stop_codon:yes gene_type:complete